MSFPARLACFSAFSAALSFAPTLLAQQPATPPAKPAATEDRIKMPSGVAISPDGTIVAWSAGTREGSQIHLTTVANTDPAKERIVTPNSATNCSSTAPVWSPDSQTLAYTSTCTSKDDKPGKAQIFLWSKATGESKQLTHLTGNFKQAAFSPDGKTLAFLFVENATRLAGGTDAMKPWAGVIGEDGVEIQRVYGINLADGKSDWLSPLTLHIYEFDWSPTSREIAYIAAEPPGENNWWVAKLWAAPVRMGSVAAQPRTILDPNTVTGQLHGLQMAVPRWSPDGKQIAFIGGLMSDQGSTGGDVWVVASDGKSAPGNVTPGIDGTAIYEAWTGPDNIGFVEDRRGHTLLTDYLVSAHKEDARIDLGEVSLSGGSIKGAIGVSSHGVLAFAKAGPLTPPEVWAGNWNAFKQMTQLNTGAKPTGRMESIEWENEGFHVQGWLTYPKDYDSKKKYPMIVSVHGGPSASATARWGGSGTWASQGYFEFQPNPRGSFGQGEAFTMANRKDFGYGDLRDILKGMDYIEAHFPIDKDREGLTGWSYGGFMTMFAVTQTHRFRAAVAGAGLSNWQSYYGENSIGQWMIPFFGASVYDDPAVYAKSSAITFIKQATTPMLIIVGDRDGECPAPQSFEMWQALRTQGVKTQLVVYPNEGHAFRDPAHTKDRNERMVKWFAENMPAKGTKGS